MTDIPDFYDDLDGILKAAKTMLLDGEKNRKSAAHHPVVGTVDNIGRPRQRIMILRDVDWKTRQLRFHTDVRSSKVGELDVRDETSVLFYDEQRKTQLRLGGISYVSKTLEADASWAQSTHFARRCYLADPAPGSVSELPTSGLSPEIEGVNPTDEQIAPARENFAVILFTFNELEWLYLDNAGHRRARFTWDKMTANRQSQWLVP